MFTTQRAGTFALASAMILGLGGCALLEPSDNEPPTAMESCAQGKTWNLDVAALATQIGSNLSVADDDIVIGDVTAEGTQTLQWNADGSMVLASNYTVVVNAKDGKKTVVLTQVHSGQATGIAYINAEIAIPRDWDASGADVTTTAIVSKKDVEELPFELPSFDIDDRVGVELTCDAGTMTTHRRGSEITQTWTS